MITQVLEDMSVEAQELASLNDLLFREGIGSQDSSLRIKINIALTRIENLLSSQERLLACANTLTGYGAPGATSVAGRIVALVEPLKQKLLIAETQKEQLEEEVDDLCTAITNLDERRRRQLQRFSFLYNLMACDIQVALDLIEYFEGRVDGKRMPLVNSVVVLTTSFDPYEEGTRGVVEKMNYHKDGYLQSYTIRLYDGTLVNQIPPSHLTLLVDA